jgi:hypothetical protein
MSRCQPRTPCARREALSLLGATTGSVVAVTLTARTAAAQPRDVIGAATPARPRYIFGYGSLIDRQSRTAITLK